MRIESLLLLCIHFIGSLAYKPVVILHGILSGAESMTLLVRHIEEVFRSLKFFVIVYYFRNDLLKVMKQHYEFSL